jgi:hypothetical protein
MRGSVPLRRRCLALGQTSDRDNLSTIYCPPTGRFVALGGHRGESRVPTAKPQFRHNRPACYAVPIMPMEPDNRTREELLADAATARHQASRFRQAAVIVNDDLVESALQARARELDTLVALLEAKVAKMSAA